MANARLTVEIAASEAKFKEDLGKAVRHAEGASKQIGVAFSALKGFIGGIAGALSVRMFVNLIQGSIDAADKLNDLSKSTGVAVETLGGIGFAAKQSGTDLDGAAKAIGKFNLTIAKATAGNQEAVAFFGKLGISLNDLKKSSPDEVLIKTATAFESFKDGANKAALGQAGFGKAYQDIIPLLNEGGDSLRQNIEYFKKYGGITTETAKQADKFNDTIEKLSLLNGRFIRNLTAELLPALDTLAERFVEVSEKGDGFKDTASDVADILKGLAVAAIGASSGFVGVGRAIGGFVAATVALARGEGALSSGILKEAADDAENRLERAMKLIDAINNPKASTASGKKSRALRDTPSLGSVDRDDAVKRVLDQQIKALENSIREEEDTLKDRESFLQTYYQDDKIAIREYFDTRQSIISDALQKELAAYDEMIAILRSPAANKTAKDTVENETKVAEIIAKKTKLSKDVAIQGVKDWLDQEKAANQFMDKIEEVALRLAQMSGDTITADLSSFDRVNAEFKARADLQAASDDEEESRRGRLAQKQFAALREITVQHLQLNKVQKDYGDQMGDLVLAQGRINLLQEAGVITELDAINRKSELTRSYIQTLRDLADEQARIASELPANSEAQREAIRNVERLRLEIDALEVSADALEKKFSEIFTGAVADGLTELITGTKSVKEAFKDMEKQIVASISRIASQNIAESIFGKSGIGGGAGGFMANLFGGGSGGGIHGGGIGDWFVKLFGAAGGTNFAPGGMTLVGERGPEIVNLPRGAQVIPNHVLASKRTQRNNISININVPGNTSRASADQIAAATANRLQVALARLT